MNPTPQNTLEFLDEVKKRHGLTSDYQLAKFFGWRTQRITMYRHHGTQLDGEACLQVAQALNLEPGAVLAEIEAVRAKSSAVKAEWKRAALKLAGAAALCAAVLLLGGENAPPLFAAFTSARSRYSVNSPELILYVTLLAVMAWTICRGRVCAAGARS